MQRKFVVGAMALALTASGAGAAVAAKTGPRRRRRRSTRSRRCSSRSTATSRTALRWQKDVYQIKSGGTLTIVNKAKDGPHTFSIVDKKDLPRTTKQINQC